MHAQFNAMRAGRRPGTPGTPGTRTPWEARWEAARASAA